MHHHRTVERNWHRYDDEERAKRFVDGLVLRLTA
jgi:hypothetical protein